MASDWIVPALAAGVSVAFGATVARQWWQRRRPHQLAWTIGIAAYAVASALEAWAALDGWRVVAYKLYFPLAGATVGLLGLGTIYLLRPGRWGGAAAAFVGLLALTATLGAALAPLSADTFVEKTGATLGASGPEVGAAPIPYSNPARWAFLSLNVLGALALIGGALASWWRTRSPGVLLIGVGALVAGSGGAVASLTGYDDRLMMQFLGIVIMYAGYLRSREAAPTRPARAPGEPSSP